jgi:hypothetical protein
MIKRGKNLRRVQGRWLLQEKFIFRGGCILFYINWLPYCLIKCKAIQNSFPGCQQARIIKQRQSTLLEKLLRQKDIPTQGPTLIVFHRARLILIWPMLQSTLRKKICLSSPRKKSFMLAICIMVKFLIPKRLLLMTKFEL